MLSIVIVSDRGEGLLSRKEFHTLAEVPPEFMEFVSIGRPEEFRIVTRAHVIAWRKQLESRGLSGATIRRKLAALSSLFEYLCDNNAITMR